MENTIYKFQLLAATPFPFHSAVSQYGWTDQGEALWKTLRNGFLPLPFSLQTGTIQTSNNHKSSR